MIPTTPPGVDPLVGWVVVGLVIAVLTLAGVVLKMALRSLEREKEYATLLERTTSALGAIEETLREFKK